MNDNERKLEKLTKLAELLRDDTITPSQAKQLVELLINLNKQQKDDLVKTFDGFTAEAYAKIQEAVSMVSQKHADALLEVRQLTNKQKRAHEDMMAKCMDLLMEIKSIDVQDGIDGKDADEEKIVQDVLALIPKPEIVVLDDREKIVTKINSGKNKDIKIEAKQIKGLPEFTREVVHEVGTTFQTETPLKAGANITITKDAQGANVITGSGGGTWGSITGTLSNQTDLQTALDAKVSGTSPTFTTQITSPIVYGSSVANGDLVLEGTSHATKTSSIVQIQPTSGTVLIGAVDAVGVVATGLQVTATTGTAFQVTGGNPYNPALTTTAAGNTHMYTFDSQNFSTNTSGGTQMSGSYLRQINGAYFAGYQQAFSMIHDYASIGGGTLILDQTNGGGPNPTASAYKIIQAKFLTSERYYLDGNGKSLQGYDASNYFTTTISSTGEVTLDAVGASAGFTFSDSVALGTNSLTMTGSIAATGARVTKGWFTDIESTNMPTVGGTAILTSLTAPQFTTIELGHASDTTLSRVSAGVMAVEGVTVPTISSTSTMTNKRNQPRIVSAASYTTDTGTSLDVSTCDIFIVTAQAGALKFNNPSGTPVQGEKLMIRIKDNGTARALTYDTQFRASSDLALPTTTVLSKTLYMGFIYNSTDTKWDLIAVLNNF